MPKFHSLKKQACSERQQAWELYQKGWSTARIADELNVHQSTIYRWIKRLKQEGELAFAPRKRQGRPSRLTLTQQNQLYEWLLEGPKAHGFWGDFWTIERIQQMIERHFMILYSSTSVHQLLHRLGWSLPKVSVIRMRHAEQMTAWQAELEATMRLSSSVE